MVSGLAVTVEDIIEWMSEASGMVDDIGWKSEALGVVDNIPVLSDPGWMSEALGVVNTLVVSDIKWISLGVVIGIALGVVVGIAVVSVTAEVVEGIVEWRRDEWQCTVCTLMTAVEENKRDACVYNNFSGSP